MSKLTVLGGYSLTRESIGRNYGHQPEVRDALLANLPPVPAADADPRLPKTREALRREARLAAAPATAEAPTKSPCGCGEKTPAETETETPCPETEAAVAVAEGEGLPPAD